MPYSLELIVAGLALIWGPDPGCTGSCPSTAYFQSTEVEQICGLPNEGKHQLALVFLASDLDAANSQNIDYTVRRIAGVEYGIGKIPCDLTLSGQGLGTVVTKYKQGSGCDPGAAGFDKESFDCVFSVEDIHPGLTLRDRPLDLTKVTIPGGIWKARGLAQDQDDNYVPWFKPGKGTTSDAIADAAVLESAIDAGGVVALAGNCGGTQVKYQFEERKDGSVLSLWLSNVPKNVSSHGMGSKTFLEHLYWHDKLLERTGGSICDVDPIIWAAINPRDIVIESGASGVFCPPGQGP